MNASEAAEVKTTRRNSMNTQLNEFALPETEDFIKFIELQKSNNSFYIITVITAAACAVVFLLKLSNLIIEPQQDSSIIALAIVTSIFEVFIIFILSVLLLTKSNDQVLIARWIGSSEDSFKALAILVATAYFSVLLNAKVWVGQCSSENNFFGGIYCSMSTNSLPVDAILGLVFFPMALSFAIRDVRFEIMLLSWIFTVLAIAISCNGLDNLSHGLGPLFMVGIGLLTVYYEKHRQTLAMYLLSKKLSITLLSKDSADNGRNESMEMRSMVANVAHDLKTPLSSFLTGIDFIKALVDDCENKLIMHQPELEGFCQEHLEPIRGCVEGIHNTNNFMIMTINRCLDYAKASRGMKLTPKPETIEWQETLRMPVRVMRNLQERLEINLLPISVPASMKMCSHIITDKQWLQENLLCLLSNAVKYSSKGRIDIILSLVSQDLVDSSADCGAMQDVECEEKLVKVKPQTPRVSKRATRRSIDTVLTSSLSSSHSASTACLYGTTGNADLTPTEEAAGLAKVTSCKSPSVRFTASALASIFVQRVSGHRHSSRISTESGFSLYIDSKTESDRQQHENNRRVDTEVELADADEEVDLEQIYRRQSSLDEPAFPPALSISANSPETYADSSKRLCTPTYRTVQCSSKQERDTIAADGDIENQLSAEERAVSSHFSNNQPRDSEVNSPFKAGPKFEESSPDDISPTRNQLLLKIEVQDTGIGLSDEAMKNLFNPFKQAQQLAGGTGLGLYSLARRMDALGGFYGVRKRTDGEQGSVFWFAFQYRPDFVSAEIYEKIQRNVERKSSMVEAFKDGQIQGPKVASEGKSLAMRQLMKSVSSFSSSNPSSVQRPPLRPSSLERRISGDKKSSDGSSKQSEGSSKSTSTSGQLPSYHVLLADDALPIIKMTSLLLRKRGHRILAVENGAEALDTLLDHYRIQFKQLKLYAANDSSLGSAFDVVLMDLQMPVMDGLEAVRRLRQEEIRFAMEMDQYCDITNSKRSFTESCGSSRRLSRTTRISYDENDNFTYGVRENIPTSIHQFVIGCSANSDNETMQEAFRAGVDAFMAKPFSVDVFGQIMDDFKQRQQQSLVHHEGIVHRND